jgi:hypothetical protein
MPFTFVRTLLSITVIIAGAIAGYKLILPGLCSLYWRKLYCNTYVMDSSVSVGSYNICLSCGNVILWVHDAQCDRVSRPTLQPICFTR